MKNAAILVVVSLSVVFTAHTLVAEEQPKNEASLDSILQEIRLLRSTVIRLEKRIDNLESRLSKHIGVGTREGTSSGDLTHPDVRDPRHIVVPILHKPFRPMPEIPDGIERERMSIEEWHRHEMPWAPVLPQIDKGLYAPGGSR